MSADDPTNGRKTLLPEFLPAPSAGEPLGPKERVAARARLLLQRLRGVGPAAGAAVLSLQCTGYGVVDPLPPPPGQCSAAAPMPFVDFMAMATFAPGNATPAQVGLILSTTQYGPSNRVGYRIAAVRVTGGTLVSIQDLSRSGQGGYTQFDVTIAPADATTTEIFADVDFSCGSASETKHYRISYHPPGVPDNYLTVVEITPTDGGTDAGTDAATD